MPVVFFATMSYFVHPLSRLLFLKSSLQCWHGEMCTAEFCRLQSTDGSRDVTS